MSLTSLGGHCTEGVQLYCPSHNSLLYYFSIFNLRTYSNKGFFLARFNAVFESIQIYSRMSDAAIRNIYVVLSLMLVTFVFVQWILGIIVVNMKMDFYTTKGICQHWVTITKWTLIVKNYDFIRQHKILNLYHFCLISVPMVLKKSSFIFWPMTSNVQYDV